MFTKSNKIYFQEKNVSCFEEMQGANKSEMQRSNTEFVPEVFVSVSVKNEMKKKIAHI